MTKKILLVDDDDIVRRMVKRCLLSECLDVIEAENPLDAINIFDFLKEEIGLILTDNQMNHMSGLELIKNIRSIFKPPYSHIPVILMSGTLSEEEAVAGGADAYLEKPFQLSKLVETVRRYVNGTHEQRRGIYET